MSSLFLKIKYVHSVLDRLAHFLLVGAGGGRSGPWCSLQWDRAAGSNRRTATVYMFPVGGDTPGIAARDRRAARTGGDASAATARDSASPRRSPRRCQRRR